MTIFGKIVRTAVISLLMPGLIHIDFDFDEILGDVIDEL